MRVRLSLLTLLLAGGLSAQSITGSITGIISDPSGAVIPNVTVEVTNTETNIRISVKSDASGNYTLTLPPGNYTVQAAMNGTPYEGGGSTPLGHPVAIAAYAATSQNMALPATGAMAANSA